MSPLVPSIVYTLFFFPNTRAGHVIAQKLFRHRFLFVIVQNLSFLLLYYSFLFFSQR